MKLPIAMLALVPDAFGGRGGLAQYNRDFFGALASSGVVSSIAILPRSVLDGGAPSTPPRIEQ